MYALGHILLVHTCSMNLLLGGNMENQNQSNSLPSKIEDIQSTTISVGYILIHLFNGVAMLYD